MRVGDRMLVDLRVYDSRAPRNGELAIFKAPAAALLDSGSSNLDVDFIKRVVGVPKDVVTIVNRQLFRNGVRVAEPYCKWDEEPTALYLGWPPYSYDMKIVGGAVYSREYLDSAAREVGPWMRNGIEQADQNAITSAKPGAVPANCYLVLGHHRSNSNDSHVFGFVDRRAFRGRAMFVFWPLSNAKLLP